MNNFKKILQYMSEYKCLSEQSVAEKYFKPNENIILWRVTRRCNFNCSYCNTSHSSLESNFDLNIIKKSFDRDGHTWCIFVTGGEPLIKKDIIPVLKALTEKHYIYLNTNLSTPNVKEFANVMDPERVLGINVAFHVVERQEHDWNFSTLFKNIRMLQDKNYNVWMSYILYPEISNRIEKDFENFKTSGINNISLRPFVGTYNGLGYPEAYSEREWALLDKYGKKEYEIGLNMETINFTNSLCSAGKRTFFIDEFGRTSRCEIYEFKDESLGNFFEDSFKPFNFEKICEAGQSMCPLQCFLYSKINKEII